MFERFNDRSRRIVVAAQAECRRWGDTQIRTEHLLLALVEPPACQACTILQELGADPELVRRTVESTVGPVPAAPTQGSRHLPFSANAKKSLEMSLREALDLGHQGIRSVHLLLGLLRVQGSGAQGVLAELKVTKEGILDVAARPRWSGSGRHL